MKNTISKVFYTNGALTTDIHIAQTWIEVGAIIKVVNEYKIKSFVELGTDKGGLGIWLALLTHANKDFKYLGVELKLQNVDPRFLEFIDMMKNAEFHHKDVFSDSCTDLIAEFIKKDRSLVYCDNGDKPMEYLVYSDIIKVGDLLMVHDHPKEFNEQNSDFTLLKRIEPEYLSESRIVLFEKTK